MNLIDDYFPQIHDSSSLEKILKTLDYDATKCKDNDGVIHITCYQYENQLPKPQCPHSLIYLILNLLAHSPRVVEDSCQTLVSEYFQKNQLKAPCMINLSNLNILKRSKSQTLTWIRFESFLTRLIKDKVYEPKSMSNEVLEVVKNELPMDIRGKLASVVKSCVPHCQQAIDYEEEERNKWCEILDWMSWFIGDESKDSDFD